MRGRVLIIAGSDSGGGAGIQADIKTVTALGGYAATVLTAVTVQDTQKVHAVHALPDQVVGGQVRVVLEDIGADAIKVGMIGARKTGEVILNTLESFADIPLVLDPVLVATSGDQLGDESVVTLLREEFLARASLITPNVPELEVLTGHKICSSGELEFAAHQLCEMGAQSVMAKAGHLSGDIVRDIYVEGGWVTPIEHPRQKTPHTHGTGCTLASAIATGLAQGLNGREACRRAVKYVSAAIRHAPGLGKGHGPLNHALKEVDNAFHPIRH